MHRTYPWFATGILVLVAACSTTEFKGGTGSARETVPPATSTATATATATPTATATATSTDPATSYIQYELYLTDCNGQVLPLDADKISFDLNVVVPAFAPINYQIFAAT